jgi:hypothetical protein
MVSLGMELVRVYKFGRKTRSENANRLIGPNSSVQTYESKGRNCEGFPMRESRKTNTKNELRKPKVL